MPPRRDHRRIGLLLPSSNTIQEPEFTRILPDGLTLHAARLPLRTADAAAKTRLVEDIETESRKLADADVDVIVLATTASCCHNGIFYGRELIDRIEAASQRPATTASAALILALTALNVQRLAIAAPWGDAVNAMVAAFLVASGFTVVAQRAMGHVSDLEIGLLPEQTAFELGQAVDQPQAQTVMLASANWPTLRIVDRLEAAIDKPVLTTSQISLWAVLRLVEYQAPVFGWGRLLRNHMT
jgi:maleate cis-trans isomerase